MLKKILKKIKKILVTHEEQPHQEPTLPPASSRELQLIEKLRQEIRHLPPLSIHKDDTTTEHKWQLRLTQIRNNILTHDPRNFLHWPDIRSTMYTSPIPNTELEFLKKLPEWNHIQPALKDERIGNPEPYLHLPETNSNIIHHAFHFAQLLSAFHPDVSQQKTIFEFGGGYGNMARMIYKMGFKGVYIIFDLPEFCALQEYYYLSSLDLPITISRQPVSTFSENTVVLLSNIQELKKQLEIFALDMAIATWSLSEVPADMRRQIIALIGEPYYILIGYQKTFGTVPNTGYFATLQATMNNYKWLNYEMPTAKNNYYLVGKKI